MFFYRLISSGTDISTILVAALAFIIIIMLSVMVHEISHGYAALLNGDRTAKSRGRLNLNPVNHFNLMGVLLFFIVGFGWAKPVPIDTRNFKNYKKGMIMVSLAGVAANIVMAGIWLLLLYFLTPVLLTATSMSVLVIKEFFFYLILYGVQINLMLAFFNLLPIFPLDGYNLVNTLLPRNDKYQAFMIRYGIYLLLGLIVIGQIGRTINFPYIDIFGMFSQLIQRLISAVTGIGL